MRLCYIDESGTSQIPGNTSHYVLAGLAVPVWHWNGCDRDIRIIKQRYDLVGKEIHTGWLLRPYPEQHKITNFDVLSYPQRISAVNKERTKELLRLQKTGGKTYDYKRKGYRKTEDYIHLTRTQREQLVTDLASQISKWGYARLFAECIDKTHFDPNRTKRGVDEQAFEQVVSRFEHFLTAISGIEGNKSYAILVHDNNPTSEKRITDLMRLFHHKGTSWTSIDNIVETPLFVNSQLASMIQLADLCAYALRRYLENNEEELFDLIFQRADSRDGRVVGVRHFTNDQCKCKICLAHRL